MASIGYMTIKGAKQGDISKGASSADSIGGVWQEGHEDECFVFSFQSQAVTPRDPVSGNPQGTRRHEPAVFTKPLDKASPMLLQALATGEKLDMELKFFRTATGTGGVEHFFTIKWTEVVLVEGKTVLPDTTNAANESKGNMEEWAFVFSKVELTHEIAGTSATDDWRKPVAA